MTARPHAPHASATVPSGPSYTYMPACDSQAGPIPLDAASTSHRRVPRPARVPSTVEHCARARTVSNSRCLQLCGATPGSGGGGVKEGPTVRAARLQAWALVLGSVRRFREGGLRRAWGVRAASHLRCPTLSMTARRRWPGGRQQARIAVTEASYMMAAAAAGGSGAGCGNRAMAGQSRDGSHAHGLCEGGGGDLRDGKVAARVPFRPRGACARILRSNGTSVAGS